MAQYLKFNDNTKFSVGDTIAVHQEITEGEKKRTQIFQGLVISIQGSGTGKSFTVRKVGANSIGVEKIYPVNAPFITKIEVKREGQVRRAKLYYLRDRVGKAATRIKEKANNKTVKAKK